MKQRAPRSRKRGERRGGFASWAGVAIPAGIGFSSAGRRTTLSVNAMNREASFPKDVRRIAVWVVFGAVFLAVVSLGVLHFVAASGVPRGGAVADEYLAAYLLAQEAENDKASGKKVAATWKLYKARLGVDGIRNENPGWQPTVTAYREKETKKQFWESVKDLAIPWR